MQKKSVKAFISEKTTKNEILPWLYCMVHYRSYNNHDEMRTEIIMIALKKYIVGEVHHKNVERFLNSFPCV